MTHTEIKTIIESYIKTNNKGEITANQVKEILNEICDYIKTVADTGLTTEEIESIATEVFNDERFTHLEQLLGTSDNEGLRKVIKALQVLIADMFETTSDNVRITRNATTGKYSITVDGASVSLTPEQITEIANKLDLTGYVSWGAFCSFNVTGFVGPNGTLNNDSTRLRSDYIPVDVTQPFVYKSETYNRYVCAIGFYDVNRKFISGVTNIEGFSEWKEHIIHAGEYPTGTKYAIVGTTVAKLSESYFRHNYIRDGLQEGIVANSKFPSKNNTLRSITKIMGSLRRYIYLVPE